MKCIYILLSIILLLQSGRVYGQSLAFTGTNAETLPHSGSFNYPSDDKERFSICTETKVGFGITGVGIIVGGVGLEIYNVNSNTSGSDNHRVSTIGAGMWVAGGVVAILGSVLSIDGAIHDERRYRRWQNKLSAFSAGNQSGVAYNF